MERAVPPVIRNCPKAGYLKRKERGSGLEKKEGQILNLAEKDEHRILLKVEKLKAN